MSTSAPNSFEQIKRFVWELLPFSACIVLIVLIWHEHFVFYYRYGMRNTTVIVWNTLFLIIVLFYVYPLKFLCKFLLFLLLGKLFNEQSLLIEVSQMLDRQSTADLMVIYGVGASSIFLVLMFMYRYALKNTHLLNLNKIEEFDTRTSMKANFLMAVVPLLSVALAIIFKNHESVGSIAGFSYFLYTPIMTIFHHRISKRRRRLLTETLSL